MTGLEKVCSTCSWDNEKCGAIGQEIKEDTELAHMIAVYMIKNDATSVINKMKSAICGRSLSIDEIDKLKQIKDHVSGAVKQTSQLDFMVWI